MEVAGEKVGVFGLTTEETVFISSPGPNVVFKDAAESAKATVAEYIGVNSPVSPAVEGRITKVEAPAELPTTGGESVQEPAASLVFVLGVMLVAFGVYARRREQGKASR